MTNDNRREFAKGTYLVTRMPWGLNVTGAALCSDGKVRKLVRIAETADTFFSVPATVRVNGRSVAGYVTVQTLAGLSTETKDDPAVLKFIPYQYRKNWQLLPEWPKPEWRKAANDICKRCGVRPVQDNGRNSCDTCASS